MKYKILFTLIVVINLSSFSQIKFEKGYFIDNNGVKTECLIKNMDWRSNPSEFVHKQNETSSVTKLNINTVKEFAVNSTKYTRFLVNIDRSSEKVAQLSQKRNPVFKEEV